MKRLIVISTFVILAAAFLSGCDDKPSNPPTDQLTASDLAMLMDFHAWKVPVPKSLLPVKGFRLVIVKPDGTIVPKFSTANQTGYPSCSSVTLGFRIERGTFSGHFNIQNTDGGGAGYKLSFSDTFADSNPAWVTAPVWNGNRARLATIPDPKTGAMNWTTLALELLK